MENHTETKLESVNHKKVRVKIKYFIDYWRDLTYGNKSIEGDLVHLIRYNPKELFKEFSDEIERKNLSNADNKSFFWSKVNEFSELELEAQEFIKPILRLIQAQQNKKKDDKNNKYLFHLLEKAQFQLKGFVLGVKAVEELSIILLDESEINKTKIKDLVNLIFFELMHKKYSQKKIAKIIDEIFMDYHQLEDFIMTDFPHNIKCLNWNHESEEYKLYETELKQYIDSLTIKDRIMAIENYFTKKAEKLRFVFQVEGLVGDKLDISIGNVRIYNPKYTKLFKNPSEHFDEFFKHKDLYNKNYCNGAVELDVVDRDYARKEAIKSLEECLDLLATQYIDYKVPLSINRQLQYIINSKGEEAGSKFGAPNGFRNIWDAISLSTENYDDTLYLSKLSQLGQQEIDKKILESAHQKRRAIETIENNEKILWQWVSLENLFEQKDHIVSQTLFDVIPKLIASKLLYNYAWKHYNKIYDITSKLSIMGQYKMELKLSDELRQKLGLEYIEGEIFHLKDFIDNIVEIQSHIETKSLLYEQLEYLKNVYSDKNTCLDLLKKLEQITRETMIYIYRLRNKIVHNAHNIESPIVEYYVDFINRVSGICMNTFMEKRVKNGLKTNNDIINDIIYNYDELKQELTDNGASILLTT